jgi:hypothetical protein
LQSDVLGPDEVCPVDCIHPTPDEPDFSVSEQLYTDPEECRGHGLAEWQKYIEVNAAHFRDAAGGRA